MHSFMIVRHGRVIAEGWWKPEAADKPHVLWSLSKSFNGTAVGLAIQAGKLSLDDPVLKFFPAEAPPNPSDNLKAMTVRDLLTMTCGHDTEPKAVGGSPSVKQFLAHPVPHKPGTHFQYNTHGQLRALGHCHQGHRADRTGVSRSQDCFPRWASRILAGMPAPKVIRSVAMACGYKRKTSPSSASFTCNGENGMAGN